MRTLTLGALLCLTPALGAAQDSQGQPQVEININTYPGKASQVTPRDSTPAQTQGQGVTPTLEPMATEAPVVGAPTAIDDGQADSAFSIGLSIGTTHWGPTMSLKSKGGGAASLTFIPIAIDGDIGGHLGIRLTQDLRSRGGSTLYSVLGVGISGPSVRDTAIAAGGGLGVRRVPQEWNRASLWGEIKMTALGGGGEVIAFLPLPTVGIEWGF